MPTTPPAPRRNASPAVRDKFLLALDQQDYAALADVRSYLVGCVDLLPSATCTLLGLKPGSTYGQGADAVAKAGAAAPAD
jgi:hypothetical protein